jgi:hypothetical protein
MEEEIVYQFERIAWLLKLFPPVDRDDSKCMRWASWYRYRSATFTILQESNIADESFKVWLQQLLVHIDAFAFSYDLVHRPKQTLQDTLTEYIDEKRRQLRKLRRSEAERCLLPELLVKDVFHVFEAYL